MKPGLPGRSVLWVVLALAAPAVAGADAEPGSATPAKARGTPPIEASLTDEGLRLLSTTPALPAWELRLSLTRYGGPGDARPAPGSLVLSGRDRVEGLRGPLTEWIEDRPEAIVHGLEIRAGGDAALRFDFTLEGGLTPKVSEDGQTIVFRDAAGSPVLASAGLGGVDADGREVAARWDWVEHADAPGPVLRLIVEGMDHRHPLRVSHRLSAVKGAARPGATGTVKVGAAIQSAPENDVCTGAQVVPPGGPFPYLSPVVELDGATDAGDPPPPSCQADVSHGVWFTFTPAASAPYTFSVCADAPTATTVEDTVLAIYTAGGPCAGILELAGGCSDDACGPSTLQSAISRIDLLAGTTYYIVAWTYGTAAPPAGSSSLQLLVVQHALPGPAPPNDQCAGAEAIPSSGPFPYLTSITTDIGAATTTGDPAVPSCQPNVSRSVWYSFAPAVSGRYAFSVCADGPTGTTVDDTVLAVYAAGAPCSGLVELAGGCDDDSCASEAAQSSVGGVGLLAGTTYHVLVWMYGSNPPAPGNTAIQVRVSRIDTPPNDTCAGATTLSLGPPVAGTTVAAFDDTRAPASSACFAGIGQTLSTAPGGDVAYRFTATDAGRYSFRLGGYDSLRNAVLYVASDCPADPAPATVSGCLGAANRNATSAEEVACVPLAAGQTVYVYVDEDAVTAGSAFWIEAGRCAAESEPDGSPAAAGDPACGAEGSIAPAGDADFFALGTPAAGSRVFALVDGAAGNSTDFDLRVTTATDTLEYDDYNNDVPFGTAAPNISGARLGGAASFLRLSHYSPAAQAEPYRLYAAVQPAAATATAEIEPNDTPGSATTGANDYYAGALSGTADMDLFAFIAAAGESIAIGLDLDPARDNTPFNGSLALLDGAGATLLLVNDPSSSSSSATGAGNLAAPTPYAPSEALVYRARAGGTYYAKVTWVSGTPGDYLLSIAHDCRVGPPADLAVSQTDAPDPVPPAGTVTYAIAVRNLAAHPASVVTLRDDLPAGAVVVSALPSQGTCSGAGPVVCHLGDLAAGASAGVSLVVIAPNAPGIATNTARVSTAVIDPAPANDLSAEATTVAAADSDGDGIADAADCAPADPATWTVPGEAVALLFPSASDATFIQWSPPPAPGGSVVLYDVLRSLTASDLQAAACVVTGGTAASATDADTPVAAFFYHVRARNACGGNLGTRSDGTPRVGAICP